MGSSDLASAIDDSFELPVLPHRGRQIADQTGYGVPDRRSGHWTVDDRTVLGSGIDDREDAIHNFPGRYQGDGFEAGFSRDRPISGSVLGRFAKANAADRQRQKLAVIEEECEEDTDDALTQKQSQRQREREQRLRGGKFFVPGLDDHLGIRIKGRDGRSEIIREPSLPPISRADSAVPRPAKKKQAATVESVRAALPEPSGRSDRTGSAALRAPSVVRIVAKDGEEAFVPVLGGWAGFSSTGVEGEGANEGTRARERAVEKERAERDARAAAAVREIRREAEAAELMMSGALPASIVSGRSTRSSRSSSRTSGTEKEPVKIASPVRKYDSSERASPAQLPEPHLRSQSGRYREHSKAPSATPWQAANMKTLSHAAAGSSKGVSERVSYTGRQEVVLDTAEPRAKKSYSSPSTGFHEVGHATYEPKPGSERTRIKSENASVWSTPSMEPPPQQQSTMRPSFYNQRNQENVYQHTPSEVSSTVYNPDVNETVVFSERGIQRRAQGPQQENIEQSANVGYHRSVTASYLSHHTSETPSPQVNHSLYRPASASSHAYSQSGRKRQPPRVSSGADIQPRSDGSTQIGQQAPYPHSGRHQAFSSQQQRQSPQAYGYPAQYQRPSSYHNHKSSQQHASFANEPRHHSSPFLKRPYQRFPAQQIPDQVPTVFAGRGWISPHPLSVAPSEISDPPQSAIRIPAGHPALAEQDGDGGRRPAKMTYEQWRAVQEERSLLDERNGRGERVGDGFGWQGGEEQSEQRGQGVRVQRSSRRREERARTTRINRRVVEEGQGANDGRGAEAGVGNVTEDGKVQLRMPWDQLL